VDRRPGQGRGRNRGMAWGEGRGIAALSPASVGGDNMQSRGGEKCRGASALEDRGDRKAGRAAALKSRGEIARTGPRGRNRGAEHRDRIAGPGRRIGFARGAGLREGNLRPITLVMESRTWQSGPAAPGLVLALSAAIVGTALISQHWGGLEPCILCYYQRYPWYAAIGLMIAALAVPRWRAALLWLAAALLVLDVGIAAYHVGVERKIFEGPASCASGTITGQTLDALRAQLAGKKVVRCDQPAWTLFGVSMAGYNLLAAGGVALIAAWLARKQGSRA